MRTKLFIVLEITGLNKYNQQNRIFLENSHWTKSVYRVSKLRNRRTNK